MVWLSTPLIFNWKLNIQAYQFITLREDVEMLTASQHQWEAAVMSVTENEMKQTAKAATTKIWIEVTKGEIDDVFLSKGN